MSTRFEPLGEPRFKLSFVDGVEEIAIPARRNWFTLVFLSVWLSGWSLGGVAAIWQVLSDFNWFLVFWLCGWALGWVFAAVTVAWQLTGKEFVSVKGTDLEIGHALVGLRRSKHYHVTEVRDLKVVEGGRSPLDFLQPTSFGQIAQGGSIKFDYGAKTVRFAGGLDEAEAKQVVARLHSHLPIAARGLT